MSEFKRNIKTGGDLRDALHEAISNMGFLLAVYDQLEVATVKDVQSMIKDRVIEVNGMMNELEHLVPGIVDKCSSKIPAQAGDVQRKDRWPMMFSGPYITTEKDWNREWIHERPLQYYLHKVNESGDENHGMWCVVDRYVDYVDGGFFKRKADCVKSFIKRHARRDDERIDVVDARVNVEIEERSTGL